MNTELLPAGGLILCAVSGGADSMYLLCRLRALGYPVAAAHYNHGLRGAEADRDEALVRVFCDSHDVPFIAGRGDVRSMAADRHMGLEEAAREARYAFLERAADECGAAVIATAHTADDNLETMLMHLARGTGLAGLCGIPPVRGRVVRPMLDVTRDEVTAYLHAHGIPHAEDSTNAEDLFARNRIRHTAVPALRAENPNAAAAAARAAALLREDEAYLSGLAAAFVRENETEHSLPAGALCALPRPVATRAVRIMAGRQLSAEHTEAILRAARDGGFADVPGLRAGRAADRLVFGVSETDSLPDRALFPGASVLLPEAGLAVICERMDVCPALVHKSFNTFYFKCENICGNITVTARKPGDAFRPAGRGCTKTMKQLFSELGIPAWERGRVPVLRDEAGVLAVCGMPAAERACAVPGDGNIIKIEFVPQGSGPEGANYAAGR